MIVEFIQLQLLKYYQIKFKKEKKNIIYKI